MISRRDWTRRMLRMSLFAGAFCFLTLSHSLSYGAISHSKGVMPQAYSPPLSQAPSAPPVLGVKPPLTRTFGCQRQVFYQGKLMDCDSNLYPDAEKLRSILSPVPSAIAELDLYQNNRYSVRKLAYVSTLGFALAGLGSLMAGQYYTGSQAIALRNLTVIPGMLLVAASGVYGFGLLSVNEKHLTAAIETYNQARPDNRIEIKFSTGIHF